MSWRYPMSDPNENQAGSAAEQLIEETLVEEISIDGMCGVY
jgi:mycofactocin precursor